MEPPAGGGERHGAGVIGKCLVSQSRLVSEGGVGGGGRGGGGRGVGAGGGGGGGVGLWVVGGSSRTSRGGKMHSLKALKMSAENAK